MPLNKREQWMAQTMADVFGVSTIEAQEALMKEQTKQLLDSFFKNQGGPTHIFVYYQPQYTMSPDNNEIKILNSSNKEFLITDGEKFKLLGKGLYFLRADIKDDKPINTNSDGDDGSILFGEVSEHSITTLNTTINQCFKPMVDSLTKADWKQCEEDSQKEFNQVFEKFSKELREALHSINNNIQLEAYPEKYDPQIKMLLESGSAKGPEINKMIEDFQSLFERWSTNIQNALDQPETGARDNKDAGPKDEIDFWKQKMRKLTGIAEQLRSRNCQVVRACLSAYKDASNESGGARPKDSITLATSKWLGLDLRITEQLNEAKDNVKYLQTLDKFIEPLDHGTPESIKEILPALMNSIKMIHTIARYYSTHDRMTGLFSKITTSMIKSCKNTILNLKFTRKGETPKKGAPQDDAVLWQTADYPPGELIPLMQSCIDLNAAYQKQYEFTKERLMNMPRGKQFDFSPQQIFGRFDLFCRRIGKLMELFGTMQQFNTLGQHKLEKIQPIINSFNKHVQNFKKMNHRLLEYSQNKFDRDFVAFNVNVSTVETELQTYIHDQFERSMSINESLQLLRKFKSILHRENLAASLNAKYQLLFSNYGREIHKIERHYQDFKPNPPICHNLPTVSGSIGWSRHLFNRISVPMEQFPPDIIKLGSSKKFVKAYNKVGYTLFSYEYLWRQKWAAEVDRAKAGLQATLIIRHPENNKLYVNFDSEIMTLIREAKCLSRIGSIDIPESAKIVLLQEDKFKSYKNELEFVLREYDRIVNKIRPNTKSLLVPHLEDLEYKLRPGMVTLTWTSMNIDGYLNHVHQGLAKLEQLIININDIMENRIENNLKSLSKTVLVNLPQDAQTFTLDEFVEMQEKWIKEESEKLKSKNFEVEGAVEDLIQTICSYQLDQHVEPISAEEIQKLSKYYNWSMYQALLHATKYSLNQMKERICGRRNMPKLILKPFFEVDVKLDDQQCTLKPTLDEVQRAINRAASHVLKSTKNVENWCQKNKPEAERDPFYTWIARDKEIVKVILLLTGSIQGTRTAIMRFLDDFSKYDWLWKNRIDDMLRKFNSNDPTLEDFENQLLKFSEFEQDILQIQNQKQIGALSLKTDSVKTGLRKWISQWKATYAKDLFRQASSQIESLKDDMKHIKLKIEKPAQDIDSLGNVMHALEEIRAKQADIEISFRPVIDMYRILEIYIPEVMEKEEINPQQILDRDWQELVQQAGQVRDELMTKQSNFKRELIRGIGALNEDVADFKQNFDQHGPAVKGIAPREALNRLRMFREEYDIRKRRFDSYNAGETLFGLPNKQYPDLEKTAKELNLLDQLYSLYQKVNDQIGKWKEFSWAGIQEEVPKMDEQIEQFGKDRTRLPGVLKQWDAYKDLMTEIESMQALIPIIEALARDSIKPRHWEEIIELTKEDIPYSSETFTLSQLLAAPILDFQEEVEEIAENAVKQEKLEKQLNEDIIAYWDKTELDIQSWKNIEQPCFIGGAILDIQEKLEEHIMQLNQMAAMRYVTPFKAEVNGKIGEMALVQETLEKWLRVQGLWTNLVSVFTTGDIVTQMPTVAKKFRNIDKQWLKLMERAADQKNVLKCCKDDILGQSLPSLQEELDYCEKQLEEYLEGKRNKFPRFYFVSNPDLLKILSVGSDPQAVQDDFAKLFDAIEKVTFDESDRRLLTEIIAVKGNAEEKVVLQEGVRCEGNIEDWLCKLEAEMQRSVRAECGRGSQDVFAQKTLKDYFLTYISQVALIGLQMLWAAKVTECLEKTNREKIQELNKKKLDIDNIMTELTALCLDETLDRLKRTRVETLVTIHVRQREIFTEIRSLAQKYLIKDANDFDWVKNTRCSWNPESSHAVVQITDWTTLYSYEFLGAKERLCITPLTDKCYITLAQALSMLYGGAPAGPAGTGKTETVKDLGCTLGIYVVVTNCSDEHKFKDMAKIFKGVCQSGLWGCFDEFNRISLPTLSVVAAQVASITNAKKAGLDRFMFPGEPAKIKLVMACGYFITMNPGYAGRQELPENLKVLFRNMSMMVPDRKVIIAVKLASQGYTKYDMLALKFHVLYKLCEDQLSKTRHYDFGLRNILSVLRTAGSSLREDLTADEEMIMCRTLRDMNLSKFISQDIGPFKSLLEDIFARLQGVANIPQKVYKDVDAEIKRILKEKLLEERPEWKIKVIQLHETSLVRHGFMVCGAVGCGKSAIYNTLTEARSKVIDKITNQQTTYKIIKMNPKAITSAEMYGVVNPVSGEWLSGVFSELWKKANDKKNKIHQWINCDGPVDAMWIENLNTVLDDNKILTLANNERIPMTDLCKMTFEVENLNNASPATVSRCGIIYVSADDLGWEPLIQTWIKDRVFVKASFGPDEANWCKDLTQKYLKGPELFKTISREYNYMLPIPECIAINNMLNLLNALLLQYQQKGISCDKAIFEKLWVFCLSWAIGGLFEADEREKFHKWLEARNAPLPAIQAAKISSEKETIFDYFLDETDRTWKIWEPLKWDAPKKIKFSQLLIPTSDSTRAEYVIKTIATLPVVKSELRKEPGQQHTLLVGSPGTAKTSVIIMYSNTFDTNTQAFKRINFSFATEPFNYQENIESEIEKKVKTYQPLNGKDMTVFLDDLAMPAENKQGDQVTLEIARQLIEQKGFYILNREERGAFRDIIKLNFLAAMAHPTGGRRSIPNRLKRHFFSLNMTPPSQKAIVNIYGKILEALFNPKKYTADVVAMKDLLIEGTIEIWTQVNKKLLPTPKKFHYMFTIRELARVFSGIANVAGKPEYEVIKNCTNIKEKIKPELFLIALWRHECERVFNDKLINYQDKRQFMEYLDRITKDVFRDKLNLDDEQLLTSYLFADYQREDEYDEYGDLVAEAPYVYEACPDMDDIRNKTIKKLELHNEKFASKKMELVIFDDALSHLLRITRVINAPSGNMLLVGVGGSGKKSLTKLAAFICKHDFFQIALTKTYNDSNLKDDVRELYRKAGPAGKQVAFIMTDAEIKKESFLEAINSMLATGEIPGLIPKEDKDLFAIESKNVWIKEEGSKGQEPPLSFLWNFFLRRVKDCLHMILAFSPVGKAFRERASNFPSLFSQCNIDWFLPWPEEALVSVAQKFLKGFSMDADEETITQLEKHMGKCHNIVADMCDIYAARLRRHVYVTPKSYLSFIAIYKTVYEKEFKKIDVEERNIRSGLDKLADASESIAALVVVAQKEDAELKEASAATDKLLFTLNIESKKAKEKSDQVNATTIQLGKDKDIVMADKAAAEEDLANALPFLRQAEAAVDSIQAKDVNEMAGMAKPADITKIVMDAIQILFQKRLDLPNGIKPFVLAKKEITFVRDSYATETITTLKGGLIAKIIEFSGNERDCITEETVELLEPYLAVTFDGTDEKIFVKKWAAYGSSALVGMAVWAAAMVDYYKASKIVNPKLKFLEVKLAELREAEQKLKEAESELQEVEALKANLKKQFDASMKEKNDLEEKAAKTKKKMDQATRLINSLKDNKDRWIQNASQFKIQKKRLIGDVAKACAFISYCGPFNSEFRAKLLNESFHNDIMERQMPVSEELAVTDFFVDHAIKGRWANEGLPSDDLSIQNAIMVERSSRYPLMIDPQGQALQWIKKKEPILLEYNCISTLTNPRLRDDLKVPLQEGFPFLIESIENDIDPMLDPILEKSIIRKGRSALIKLGDQEIDYDDKFRLYMTSRLPNPHFTPEVAAQTTIIDFTVTQGGLEQQLLSRLIGKEQKQLEETLDQLQKENVANKQVLAELEAQLLDRLANSQGSLIDDTELIDVLANIKVKSKEIDEKLQEAAEKMIDINEKRETFRPVAARGAVLYFCIVEMANVEWMYSTSLTQFLTLYDYAIENSPKAQLIPERVKNITQWLTRKTYRYINRGLFEKDKTTFKVMMATRILIKDKKLSTADVMLFLKAGAGVEDRGKLFNWMDQNAWLNLKALSKHKFLADTQAFYKALPDQMQRNEQAWKKWIDENEPENCPVPDGYEEKLSTEGGVGQFLRLCLVRCLREDRTMVTADMFISDTLGAEFIQPVTDQIQEIWEESAVNKPVLYLLTAGADPTSMIEELARKKKMPQAPAVTSMGEGQELPAQASIDNAFITGGWVILSNSHLAIEYMGKMEHILNPKDKTIDPNFRLWITCEATKEFPLGLLQMAIKVTIEPPKGLKAGLFKTFNTMINQDFLEKVEPYDKWRSIVFTLCFLHSIVQERRKFGPLGFCKAYEFNTADLEASLLYCENHMNKSASLGQPYSWVAMQYMVTQVQYGGRITDAEDNIMFDTYGKLWVNEGCLVQNYCFNQQVTEFVYMVPDVLEHSRFIEYINRMPGKDSPPIFGLHSNADLTFRKNESLAMIATLTETMPKDDGGGSGKSFEQEVQEKVEKEMLPTIPADMAPIEIADRLRVLKGPRGLGEPGKYQTIPLNIFLSQELQRMQGMLNIVKTTLNNIVQAIQGNIIMSPQIVDAINAVGEMRVPTTWLVDPSGAEISWLSPNLGAWIKSMIDRHHQMWGWVQKERPPSFWLTGFFNPQGFLTAMKQEVTRQKKQLMWSLDEVSYKTDPQRDFVPGEDGRIDGRTFNNIPPDGVLIHGLFLEGAGWNKTDRRLDESEPKVLFTAFPVMWVTAVSTAPPPDARQGQQNKEAQDIANMEKTHYFCPVYKYPKRLEHYKVFNCFLKAEAANAPPNPNKNLTPKMKWRLCGACLLCQKL